MGTAEWLAARRQQVKFARHLRSRGHKTIRWFDVEWDSDTWLKAFCSNCENHWTWTPGTTMVNPLPCLHPGDRRERER